jgi:hypothetical protein
MNSIVKNQRRQPVAILWAFGCCLALGGAACPSASSTTTTGSSGDPGSTSSSSSGGASSSSGSSGMAGGVGAGCDSTHPCGDFKGAPLECTNGTCALAGCPTGTLSCPCTAGTTCESTANCQAQVCVAPGCTAGQAGCGCAGDACSAGTQCVAGFCRYPTRLGIRVDNLEVRACDVLVSEQARTIQSAAFSVGVVGEQVRRGKKWAFSFTRRADEGGQGAVVTLEFGGMAPVSAADVQVLQSRCYDAAGAVVAQPAVTLQ